MRYRYLVPIVSVISLAGCTQAEIGTWLGWYETNPQAAIDFANTPEVQNRLNSQALTNNHPARWEAIAWCESGRTWDLRASNRTGTYGGGLMIRDNVWRAYGGTQYATTADQATKEQQIDIAERILADVGWGAWDCA